jgi:hypothetical protein
MAAPLAPGVYIEELHFPSTPIEGLPTSKVGFIAVLRPSQNKLPHCLRHLNQLQMQRNGTRPHTIAIPRALSRRRRIYRAFAGTRLATLE